MAWSILNTILVMLGIIIFGGGGGYLIWVKTRPKKPTWKAFVWQLTDAKHDKVKGLDGKEVGDLDLRELRLYGRDLLIKDSEVKDGITVFKLSRLLRTVKDVTPDCITNYGEKIGEYVDVLFSGDSCTLLRRSYDNKTGRQIWNPMPYDRINALKNDIAVRKSRIHKKADVLAQILPYVAILMSFMFILGVAYMSFGSARDIAKENTVQAGVVNEGMVKVAEINRDGMIAVSGTVSNKLGVQKDG